MPLLSYQDVLPYLPQRVLIAGTSGSGKTTLAAKVAEALGIPHIEIDSLFHGSNWTQRDGFVDDVQRLVAAPGWVTEWQYSEVRPLLAGRADLVVWLDLSRFTVMQQVVRRTLRRRLRRETLWNDNVEPPLWTIFTEPKHIVRWAWSTHHKTATRIARLVSDRPSLPVVRLRRHGEAASWLTGALTGRGG